ncbi:MAG: succinate dehydrogenase, hydrophobic membrane anchor protein [Alphaproteobacteria bacterium]|nr:MAG: succinate dehydrogenase, hydrophobic membrane anchor protein [Alphaproteobacteria bacterium]
MTLRTPLGRARGLGTAKSGTRHWWLQRVTAIALAPLMVWFVISAVGLVGADHAVVMAWIADPVVAVLLLLLVGVLFFHMRLGLAVAIEDYVHQEGIKIGLLLAVNFAALVMAAAAAFAILKIALGV